MSAIQPHSFASDDLEAMAAALERSGVFRVQRMLAPLAAREPPADLPTRLGLFVDTETTGLDHARDEIIELAMVPFTYGVDGEIYEVGAAFEQLRQPSKPISAEISALTGITDAMVEGRTIDPNDVAAFAAPAVLVVAHNAAFDRRFLERFCDVFTTKPWACSMTEIDWTAEGYEGTKLAYLASNAGFFYERHRATNDCLAAIELLARRHAGTGRTGLQQLLECARTPSWRIWAENSPYDFKDVLKARGYRWNREGIGGPQAWYTDVSAEQKDAELASLRTEIYRGEIELLVRRIDAYDRFSARV
ncbi:3'-5' exonuclease [Caulobacter vibrioides]|nr:3'-5' exonuclease [Caulobacter vibrioides]